MIASVIKRRAIESRSSVLSYYYPLVIYLVMSLVSEVVNLSTDAMLMVMFLVFDTSWSPFGAPTQTVTVIMNISLVFVVFRLCVRYEPVNISGIRQRVANIMSRQVPS